MLGELLVLGFVLSLDNFRTAIALGGATSSVRHAVQVALVFGFWDGVAPLVGILGGRYVGEVIGETAEYIGAGALGLYGLYLLVQAWRTAAPEALDERWALFGLTIPLSLDNVLAGSSLGLLGFSPWLAPPLFGVMTVLMTFVGLQIGQVVVRFVRVRADLVTGLALVVMAIALGLGQGLGQA